MRAGDAIVLLALAGGGALAFLGASSAPAPPPGLEPSPYDERMANIEREAIEGAFRAQMQSLFLTWMKDPHGQPGRAITGAAIARKAYIDSMSAIDGRSRR